MGLTVNQWIGWIVASVRSQSEKLDVYLGNVRSGEKPVQIRPPGCPLRGSMVRLHAWKVWFESRRAEHIQVGEVVPPTREDAGN